MGYMYKGKCAGGFFFMPQWLYDGGIISSLKPSAQVLLMFFYHVQNRVSTPRFKVSERVISRETGLTENTIKSAREELGTARLVQCERASSHGAPYIYHLFNPENKEPFPANSKKPATYDPETLRQPTAVLEECSGAISRPARGSGAVHPPEVRPLPVESRLPLKNDAAPRSEDRQEKPWRCHTCKSTYAWFLPDGAPVCSACHPKSSKPVAPLPPNVSALSELATSTRADPEMTEHGLAIKF
jgi:hypothetical protein